MRMASSAPTRRARGHALERLATLVLGSYLIADAALHASRAEWVYTDLVRVYVPVPAALGLGVLLLWLAVFRWRW